MPAMLELPHAGCYMPAVAALGGRTSHGSAPSTFAGSQEVQAGIHSAQGGTNAVCANAHSPSEKGKPTEHQSNLVPTWSFTLGDNKQHPSPDPFVKS